MSINKAHLEGESKKKRPLGVWILTLYTFLYVSFFVLIYSETWWNFIRGYTAMYKSSEIPVFHVYAFLSTTVIIASILTWGGLEVGRKSFLIFVAVLFLGHWIDEFGWGTSMPDIDNVSTWVIYITDFVLPFLCLWYFNRPVVKEFFVKE